LPLLQEAARLDAARMLAHLALGDRQAALADWRDGLALYRALAHEPSLICGLVRIANLRFIVDAMWQGLAAHQWAEADLRTIATDLGSLDLLADLRFALASERSGVNGVAEDLMRVSAGERAQLISLTQGPGTTLNPGVQKAWQLYPSGWFRESQVKINELFDRRLAQIDPAHGRMISLRSSDEELVGINHWGGLNRLRYILVMLLMPSLNSAEDSYAAAHTAVLQARTACALELFRIAHGAFPERLEEMVPAMLETLPLDAMDGAPLRYRRTAEDGFVLWSIGLNRVDEGGKSDPDKNIRDQPDWVWHS